MGPGLLLLARSFLVVLCVSVGVPEACGAGAAAWLVCLRFPRSTGISWTGELVQSESSDPHWSAFTVGNPSGRQNFAPSTVP